MWKDLRRFKGGYGVKEEDKGKAGGGNSYVRTTTASEERVNPLTNELMRHRVAFGVLGEERKGRLRVFCRGDGQKKRNEGQIHTLNYNIVLFACTFPNFFSGKMTHYQPQIYFRHCGVVHTVKAVFSNPVCSII